MSVPVLTLGARLDPSPSNRMSENAALCREWPWNSGISRILGIPGILEGCGDDEGRSVRSSRWVAGVRAVIGRSAEELREGTGNVVPGSCRDTFEQTCSRYRCGEKAWFIEYRLSPHQDDKGGRRT